MVGLCCRTAPMKLIPVLCVVIVVVVWPRSSTASSGRQSADKTRPSTALAVPVAATCDKVSCEQVEDKDVQGWEAIKVLHRQLDDDANGNVDLSESDEFLRDELKYEDNFDRHNVFHGDDNFISVDDLWVAWKNSEVYNWTVEETLHWLVHYVELPQYLETFQNNAVDGPMLPRLAVNNQFLATILGIKDPVHKQKIIVKAMDVVLFGPPKPSHNYVKDTALVLSLVIAVGGCWFAYIQHRYSKYHMKQMMKDMESLQRAEESLSELQEKLQQAHQQKKSVLEEKESLEEKMRNEIRAAKAEAERLHVARENTDTELNRLRLAEEELVQVRRALKKAESELEYRSGWFTPPLLQQWLQVTHEVELIYYNMKKQAAEQQLAAAKEGCEKLRKKRTTFMGSFRIAHGNSMDEVDHRIISAKAALNEVTSDLQERLHRWGQIEQILGLPIVNNPGLSFLTQSLQGDGVSPSTMTSDGTSSSVPPGMSAPAPNQYRQQTSTDTEDTGDETNTASSQVSASSPRTVASKKAPTRSKTEQLIGSKPTKSSVLKFTRSSSDGDLLGYESGRQSSDNGCTGHNTTTASSDCAKDKSNAWLGSHLTTTGKSSSEADLSKLGRPFNRIIMHARFTNSTDQLFHGSPSSPLIAGNLTPMELNPHMSVDDCDEDLPPTYSMVTDASNHSSALGAVKRTQALRTVQSASCLSSMPVASTSTALVYRERHSNEHKPSTNTQQTTSQVLKGDCSPTDIGAASTQKKQCLMGNLSDVKEDKQSASQDQIHKIQSAATSQNPTKPNPSKEQIKMSQSSGALIAVKDMKKVLPNHSIHWLTQSKSVPKGGGRVTRPNTLPISQSERNLSTMTSHSTSSENNNCSTLPPTTKKKTGWFKKHTSPTAAVLDDNHEAGDSSDSVDSDDKKKKRKKLSFGKSKDKDKQKQSWYLQQ